MASIANEPRAMVVRARPKRPRSRRALALALLALAGIATSAAAGSPATPSGLWEPVPPEAWREPARPDSGGGDAIVLLDQSEYFDHEGRFVYSYFGRARVFTPEGRDIATVEIPYPRGQWKITELRARSVLPMGRTTEFDRAQLIESRAFRYGETDLVRATVVIPGVEPGCVVEWAYTLEGATQEFGGWRFPFANRFYTCVSSHTWHSSSWWKDELARNWRYAGIPRATIEEVCAPNCKRPQVVTFTARGMPGVHEEELAPPAEDATPRVTVFYGDDETTGYWSLWKGWFDLAREEYVKESPGLAEFVRTLKSRYPQPDSALAAAFRWTRANLHSLAELPWDRRSDEARIRRAYKPAKNLDALLERSEAMPFEINLFMVAVAQELGFTASLGFVGDRRYSTFDRTVRGFPPLNLVTVVERSGGPLYLNPASRFAPYGSIPWNLRGGFSLLSGPTNMLFRRVPTEVGGQSAVEWGLDLQLDAEGGLDGRIRARLDGEEAAELRRELWEKEPPARRQLLETRLAEHEGPRVTFEDPDLASSADSAMVLNATAHWPQVATVAGDRILVPTDRLIPWRTRPRFRPEHRKQPILFRNPRVETFRLRVQLAPGLTVERLPDPIQLANAAGSWSLKWEASAGVVTMERRLTIPWGEIGPQDYPLVRELFHGLERGEQAALVVSKQP